MCVWLTPCEPVWDQALLQSAIFQTQPQSEVPSFVEPEWAQAWLDHQANSLPLPHIHLPIQFGGGIGSDVEQWRELVAAYFPADQVDHALTIMACESGGNAGAKNPTSSARGLFQILASLWAPNFGVTYEALYDPETNVRLARRIWDQSGWGAWSCH